MKRILSVRQIYQRINDLMRQQKKEISIRELMHTIYDENLEELHPTITPSRLLEFLQQGIDTNALDSLCLIDDDLALPKHLIASDGASSWLNEDDDDDEASHSETENVEEEPYLYEERIEANRICRKRWSDMPSLPRVIYFLQMVHRARQKLRFSAWQAELEHVLGGTFDFEALGLFYPEELITRQMYVAHYSDDAPLQIVVHPDIVRAFIVKRSDMDSLKRMIFDFLFKHGGKASEKDIQNGTGLAITTIFDAISASCEVFDTTFGEEEALFSLKKDLLVVD